MQNTPVAARNSIRRSQFFTQLCDFSNFKTPKMNHIKTFPFLLFLFFMVVSPSSCKRDTSRNEILRIVQMWQGKEILFPQDIVFTIHGTDIVVYEIPISPHKIVVYVDSVGCMSCRFHFDRWNELISEIDSLTNATVPVLFFFHTKNPREVSLHLQRDNLNIPVVFDLQDKLNSLNQFPTHHQYQTFLLDENNKVVLVGNPINNPAIKEIYLQEITSGRYQTTTRPSQATQIEVDQTEFDLGIIPKGEAETVTVLIKNVGNAPLIIFDTRVSCGCTNVSYDKQPIAPNTTTEINITYNADDTGRFDRTVSIFGNMANSPQMIRLRGIVE
jgi:hypothetical protein